jgi:hypothetical protein
MQAQLSVAESDELKDMGMSEEQVELVAAVVHYRIQPTGPDRMYYFVRACKRRELQWLVSRRNRFFEVQTKVQFSTFKDLICKPMMKAAQQLQLAGDKGWTRSCQLTFDVRVYRMLLYLNNESDTAMFITFDQHPTTCARDAQKLVDLAYKAIVSKWVRMPGKGTREYKDIVGAGVFAADLSHCVYAADMTPVYIAKPVIAEKLFYDGHRKRHTLNLLTFVDGHGYTRHVAGPFPGSTRDSVAVAQVDLERTLKR